MSPIRTLRQWLRALSPALLASLPSAHRTEQVPARGGSAADAHAAGRARCWLGRNLWSAHGSDTQGSFVDAGESYYAASRERAIVRALYEGSVH
ncbi:MAG: hypothetical protein JNN03_12380 [Rubrivivax sp.]|nr:hypothetical protein [Rubrivivax sp.]